MAIRVSPTMGGSAVLGPPKPREEFLYAMGFADGPIKVGRSYDVRDRLKQLQSSEGSDLQVLHFCEVVGGYGREGEMFAYWLLRERHHRGEWFNVTLEEAREAIDKAANRDYRCGFDLPPLSARNAEDHYTESVQVKVASGTYARTDVVRASNESRRAFFRTAIENELARREALNAKPD